MHARSRPRVYVNDTCVFRAAYIITGCQYRALSRPRAASHAVMYALIVRPLRFERPGPLSPSARPLVLRGRFAALRTSAALRAVSFFSLSPYARLRVQDMPPPRICVRFLRPLDERFYTIFRVISCASRQRHVERDVHPIKAIIT